MRPSSSLGHALLTMVLLLVRLPSIWAKGEEACSSPAAYVRLSQCPEADGLGSGMSSSSSSSPIPGVRALEAADGEPWVCCQSRVSRRSIGESGRGKPTVTEAPSALPLTLKPASSPVLRWPPDDDDDDDDDDDNDDDDEAAGAIPLLPPTAPSAPSWGGSSSSVSRLRSSPSQYDSRQDPDVWFPDAALRPAAPTAAVPHPRPSSHPGSALHNHSRQRPGARPHQGDQHVNYHVNYHVNEHTSHYQDHAGLVHQRPTPMESRRTSAAPAAYLKPATSNIRPAVDRDVAASKHPRLSDSVTTASRQKWGPVRAADVSLSSWGPPTIAPRRRPSKAGSISDRKCAEFSRLQTERVVALPLVPDPAPSVQHVQKCDTNSVPLVVGGQDARLHEFPHMAAIGYRGNALGSLIEWNCGGSLINDVFVLTAAHCTATAQGPPIRVRLGEHNLESSEDGARPVDIAVSSMIRHPGYQPPARYHDIGLLRLARRVTFGPAIRPACLYSGDEDEDDTFANEPLIAIGWGHTEQLGEKSQVLQKVVLNLVDQRTCSNLYAADASTSSLSRGIAADSQLCAGALDGGRDTCQGDSGGPLQVTSHNNQCVFHIVGITSFGKVCAAKNSPGVYTRVSNYLSWIERHVWPEERGQS